MINKPNSKLPGIICEFSFPARLQAEPEQMSQSCLGGIQSGSVSGVSQERPRTPCSLSALPPTSLRPGKACNPPCAKLLGPLVCKTEQTHTCPLGSLSTKRVRTYKMLRRLLSMWWALREASDAVTAPLQEPLSGSVGLHRLTVSCALASRP